MRAGQDNRRVPSDPTRQPVRVAVVATIALAVAVVGLVAIGQMTRADAPVPGVDLPSTVVVGDLGGVPVTMPAAQVSLVQYEGDPGWGSSSPAVVPSRNHTSRLVSFGLDVRWPDMTVADTPALRDERAHASLRSSTWIGVTILAGPYFGASNPLDRLAAAYVADGIGIFRFEPLAQHEHGLEVFAVRGVDPATGRSLREHAHAEDLFVHRNDQGRVDAVILCSHRPNAEAALCRHHFTLEPAMRARGSLQYRRALLPQWQQIHGAVARLMRSFAHEGPPSNRS